MNGLCEVLINVFGEHGHCSGLMAMDSIYPRCTFCTALIHVLADTLDQMDKAACAWGSIGTNKAEHVWHLGDENPKVGFRIRVPDLSKRTPSLS